MIIVGSLILLIGTLSMLTPFPGGTLLIALGSSMLLCSSQKTADFVRRHRISYPRLDQSLRWIESKVGMKLSQGLRLTRPERRS